MCLTTVQPSIKYCIICAHQLSKGDAQGNILLDLLHKPVTKSSLQDLDGQAIGVRLARLSSKRLGMRCRMGRSVTQN